MALIGELGLGGAAVLVTLAELLTEAEVKLNPASPADRPTANARVAALRDARDHLAALPLVEAS